MIWRLGFRQVVRPLDTLSVVGYDGRTLPLSLQRNQHGFIIQCDVTVAHRLLRSESK